MFEPDPPVMTAGPMITASSMLWSCSCVAVLAAGIRVRSITKASVCELLGELLLSESASSLDVGEVLPVMTMGCPCEEDVVVGMMLRTSTLLS